MVGISVFTAPFNRLDGYGDGPFDPTDPDHTTSQNGNRPGIQTNLTPFLRVNGADAQSCLECHSVLSTSARPLTFAIGGHGGLNNSPIPGPTGIDVNAFDEKWKKNRPFAFLNGRFINPPFLFGAGGIELLAKEMTKDLQNIKETCLEEGGLHEMVTKGVHFGTITCASGNVVDMVIDSDGQAINADLVVRPFGRKGEFSSIRAFDKGALEFHQGMQAEEVMEERLGDPSFDGDNDGITNEVTHGESTALAISLSCLPTPTIEKLSHDAEVGLELFHVIGCANCHIPELKTDSRRLTQAFPEVETDPDENVFIKYKLRRSKCPTNFKKDRHGGLIIELFSDLKRHDMGDLLAETAEDQDGNLLPLNRFFITARLWGLADSAPYLHDGRAQTITEAILLHDGEAQEQREIFKALSVNEKNQLLAFLRSLRVPTALDVKRAIR
jgi:hypothetical protein